MNYEPSSHLAVVNKMQYSVPSLEQPDESCVDPCPDLEQTDSQAGLIQCAYQRAQARNVSDYFNRHLDHSNSSWLK